MLQFQSEMVWYGIHVSELNRFGWFSKRSVVLGTCQRGPWLRWVHLYRPITSNKRYNATLLEGSNLGYKSQKLDSKNLTQKTWIRETFVILCVTRFLKTPRQIGVILLTEEVISFLVALRQSNCGIRNNFSRQIKHRYLITLPKYSKIYNYLDITGEDTILVSGGVGFVYWTTVHIFSDFTISP